METFGILDYCVFAATLVISAMVGVFFAFCARTKQDTTAEYLMGSRSMGIFPVSMSLIASYISGIALLGIPAEIYVYGTQYWTIVIAEAMVSLTIITVILPVFYGLKIVSSYEYLKMRFSQPVRLLGSGLFLIKMMLYVPIVVYVPALALSQVTGMNLHYITPIVCGVCIFYTTIGGLKAVVWTDTIQTVLMFLGVIIVLVLGTINVGGPGVVLQRNLEGDRIELFNLDLDPTVRHTMWNTVFGNYFSWLAACSVNQAMIQRCLSMPTRMKANIAVVILAVGIFAIVSMSCYTGLVLYATFHDCDPVSAKKIGKPDQLLPYFVMQMSQTIPGLPGLFISGVFSAALSSMSTSLNSMTGVIWKDLIQPNLKRPVSEARASFIMKVIVVIIGVVTIGLVFLVDKLGTLIQASKSLASITAGGLLGLFMLGMLFPWANSKGALIGGAVAFALVGWISLGTQAAIAKGDLKFPRKPVSIESCNANSTVHQIPYEPQMPDFPLYRLSYMWFTMIGVLTVIIVGLAVSFITGPNDPKTVDRDVLSPVIYRFLPEKTKESLQLEKERLEPKD